MKPEELMIGDILEYIGTIVKVYSIGAKICVKECFGKNTYIVDSDNLLKGLELTPEILEKNLEKEYSRPWLTYRHKNKQWLIFYKKEFGFCLTVGAAEVRIDYVHELQHILRLCGIDKEIEI